MRTFALVCLWFAACASGNVPGIGDDDPSGDAPAAPFCGDMQCASAEIGKCTIDCGEPPPMAVCGNQKCEPPTENNTTCATDCPTSPMCDHDTVCEPPESTANCSDDCPAPAMCPGIPSGCKDCANGDIPACIALQVFWDIPNLDPAACQMCIVAGCTGQMANQMCEPFPMGTETPFTCVDCFE